MTEEQPLWESLWLKMTIVSYHKSVLQGHDHMRYRYAKEIAQSLLENLPNSAHLYVLERIHTNSEDILMWRDVLAELDEQEALNGIGGKVGEHISRRDGEPHEDEQELRDADDSNAWKKSTPSGVDESAL